MFTIYGDQRSDNCLKVRYVADLLGLNYEWQELDVLSGDTRREPFLSINPMGQIPAIKYEDGRTLAQSNAIMRHLAQNSQLIPANQWEQAQMDQWLFWEQYTHETSIAVCRFQMKFLGQSKSELASDLVIKGEGALSLMEDHLKGRDWFVGACLSLADIALFAYTQFADEGGFSVSQHSNIQGWLERTRKNLK